MNESAAKEWLNKAWHHFSSGKILYEADHYTDVIAIDLHYAVEVALKAYLAYENKKIIKTHDLNDLSIILKGNISFTNYEQKLLAIISTYHIKGSYPTRERRMPIREEIKEMIDFAYEVFLKVCSSLDIDPQELKH